MQELLAADGEQNVRALQRDIRNIMTEHCGVVRDEQGLRQGLAELDDVERRASDIGVHPDLAGYSELSHDFDLKSSILAARATLQRALERRETRGCHNRSDYPQQDPDLRVNMIWSADGTVTREQIPPVPEEIRALMGGEVSQEGKLVE